MKILKPGKVEQRKFECERCGCVFVASYFEADLGDFIICPEKKCRQGMFWLHGELCDESEQDTESDKERLIGLIFGDGEREDVKDTADRLLVHGVTFREDAP